MTAKIFHKFIEIFYWRLERARVQKMLLSVCIWVSVEWLREIKLGGSMLKGDGGV